MFQAFKGGFIQKRLLFILIFFGIFSISFTTTINNQALASSVHVNDMLFIYKNNVLENQVTDEVKINTSVDLLNDQLTNAQDEALDTSYANGIALSTFTPSTDEEVESILSSIISLEKAIKVTVDDHVFYVSKRELYDDAISEIIASFLKTDELKNIYYTTGQVPIFKDGNKKYTEIKVDSDITFKPQYVNKDMVFNSKEEVIFYLINGNVDKQVELIDSHNTYDDIIIKNQISNQNVELNNLGITEETLFFDGQIIVTNIWDPLIDIAVTYEETNKESIPYQTQRNDNSNLNIGTKKTTREGKNGSAFVTYRTKVVNGEEIYSKSINQEIITRSVDKIVEVGTFLPPSYDGGFSGNIPSDGTGKFAWPSSVRNVICGWYCYPGHAAIDIQSWYGGPIYAADSGTVTYTGYDLYGGLVIKINHGNGFATTYVHQSRNVVSIGQKVSKGQLIGYEGSSGLTTTHHLHFEILYNGVRQNPLNYY